MSNELKALLREAHSLAVKEGECGVALILAATQLARMEGRTNEVAQAVYRIAYPEPVGN